MNLLIKFCWAIGLVLIASAAARSTPILLLTETNKLVRVESSNPQVIQSQTQVTNLQPGEHLMAIDFRPLTSQLYGVTDASRLYVIDPTTGIATQVGSGPFSPALDLGFAIGFSIGLGFDFNPVTDRIRIVTGAGQNLRLNPATGAVEAVDPNVAFAAGDPNVNLTPGAPGLAFSNNMVGAGSTTLYSLVIGRSPTTNAQMILTTQGSLGGSPISPNTGNLFTVANLGIVYMEPTGLDIAPDGSAFALIETLDTLNQLYSINLATGAKSRLAIINSEYLRDLAVVLPNGVPPAGTFQIENAAYGVNEGDGFVTVTVTRNGDTSIPANVDLITTDDSARQRSDYIIGYRTLQFAAGESSRTARFLIIDDAYVESPEAFNLLLMNATGGFVPGNQSQSVVTVADNDPAPPVTNPVDDSTFFVRQQYLDFLNRNPDASGLAYWTSQITNCGADQLCVNTRRKEVSASFFLSAEFQETGYFTFRMYTVGFSRQPDYFEFTRDRNQLGLGSSMEASKTAFVNQFVAGPEFTSRHPASDTPERYVDDLNAAAVASLTQAERDALVQGLHNSTETRASVLRAVVDNAVVQQRLRNRAFVLMQYFGYMRRGPDLGGFSFWLNILDQSNNYHSMVCAFITSTEYQQRFSSVVTHGNSDCPQ